MDQEKVKGFFKEFGELTVDDCFEFLKMVEGKYGIKIADLVGGSGGGSSSKVEDAKEEKVEEIMCTILLKSVPKIEGGVWCRESIAAIKKHLGEGTSLLDIKSKLLNIESAPIVLKQKLPKESDECNQIKKQFEDLGCTLELKELR